MTQRARMIIKSQFGLRLWVLIAALFLAAGGIIYGLTFSSRLIKQFEDRLTVSRMEGFRLGGEIRQGLFNLNHSLLAYTLLRDPKLWEALEQAVSALDR